MSALASWRRVEGSSIMVYQFDWPPGTIHAMTTRIGGGSQPPYNGLNLAFHVEDDEANVQKNRELVSRTIGLSGKEWITVQQVHGKRVAWVGSGEDINPDSYSLGAQTEADGIATEEAGVPLAVFGADCGLLLFYDPFEQRIGAVHAGWRGTVAGLPKIMVEQFVQRGSRPDAIYVGIGPSIGPCCYPVGPDVIEGFTGQWSFADQVLGQESIDGKRPLDLAKAQRLQLIEAGVSENKIASPGFCTHCQSQEFFSYRRDGGRTGRQAALIMLRGEEQGGGHG